MLEFDIKYKEDILAGKYRVKTRDGRPVEILKWDRKHSEYPILALITNPEGDEEILCTALDGIYRTNFDPQHHEKDLVLVTPVEDRTPEDEFEIVLSTFAEEFELAATDYKSEEYKNCDGNLQLIIKKYVPKLLKVAKKTYQGEIHDEVQTSINNAWEEGREFGRREILEDAKDVVVLEDECAEWFKGGVSMGLSFMDIDFGDKEDEVCDNLGLCDGDKILVKVTKV